MADLLVPLRPAKSLQDGADFCGKNLSILDLLKRKGWPQCHRERAVGKYVRASFAKRMGKGTGLSVQTIRS